MQIKFRKKFLLQINMFNYVQNKEWNISNIIATRNSVKYKGLENDTFPMLIIGLTLQRHSSMSHSIYITPAIGIIKI